MNTKYRLVVLGGMVLGVISLSLSLNIKPEPQTTSQILAATDVVPSPTPTPTPTESPKPTVPEIGATTFIVKKLAGEIMAEKKINERLPPASTTKMMTALVAGNKYSLTKLITVNKPYQ